MLVETILALVIVGVIMYLINTYIPMEGKIKQLLNIVVVIIVIVWLLQSFGLVGSLNTIRIR